MPIVRGQDTLEVQSQAAMDELRKRNAGRTYPASAKLLRAGNVRVVFSVLPGGLRHAELSLVTRLPTWEEVRRISAQLAPDGVVMAAYLPPAIAMEDRHTIQLFEVSTTELARLRWSGK